MKHWSERAGRLREIAQIIHRGLRLVVGASGKQTIVWFVLVVAQGLVPAATVWSVRRVVDALVAATAARGSWEESRAALLAAAIFGSLVLLEEVLAGVVEWFRVSQSERLQDHVTGLIHQKSASLDMAFYESPEFHDRLHRARTDAPAKVVPLLDQFGNLIRSTLTFGAMAAVLLPYGAWVLALLVAANLPALLLAIRQNLDYHAWSDRSAADRRWAQYYDHLLTSQHTAAEVRMFGLAAHLRRTYGSVRAKLVSGRLALLWRHSGARVLAAGMSLAGLGGAMTWMLLQSLRGGGTLGDLALFYQAFSRSQPLLRQLLTSSGQVYGSSFFLKTLFEFLDLEPAVADPAAPVPFPGRAGIRFSSVTFRYPGSTRVALDRFSLEIPAGAAVAIVGANGAGKSTLMKLLCRLYDPDSGSIEIGGTDLRCFALDDLRRNISVLLQSPVAYQARARENIALGSLDTYFDDARLEFAARCAAADEIITRLPRGYDSMLGRWFEGGNELSAGEWQRVATARTYFRRAPIVLFDEPTSHADTWSEAGWFSRFREAAPDATAILITHRLRIAMSADAIHVVDGGRVVESGTHLELLAAGGRYAQSWAYQTQSAAQSSAV